MQGNTAMQIGRPTSDTTAEATLASLDAYRISSDQGSQPASNDSRTVAHLRRELDRCLASLLRFRARESGTATALRCAKSELRLVSAALMRAQEMERQRIAGELHDSIGQALGTVGFGLGGALDMLRAGNTPGAEETLLRIADQTRQAIGEVRRIAMDLRPATLDNLGIVGTLSWFFREFHAVHPDIAVITDIDVSELGLPAALSTAIYRVVQEACSNVVRHSGASELRVALYRRPGLILLRVEDNGRGIRKNAEASQVDQGMGLRSMRDRVEFSGGGFCVASEPGAGTCIIANWPLSGACGETQEPADPCPADIEARL